MAAQATTGQALGERTAPGVTGGWCCGASVQTPQRSTSTGDTGGQTCERAARPPRRGGQPLMDHIGRSDVLCSGDTNVVVPLSGRPRVATVAVS